jgi:hypothetical protein
LYDAFGDGAEQHAGLEVVTASADDEQRGPRVASDLDQQRGWIADQGHRLEPYALGTRSQTTTSGVQQLGGLDRRPQERLGEHPSRVDLRLDRDDEQACRIRHGARHELEGAARGR